MNWYTAVIKNYAGFSGRAHRTEFWMFILFYYIAAAVLGVIGTLIHFTLLSSIYSLALLVPYLAVAVRRLHDTNRSAWWILFILLPIIGWILLIVLECLEGTRGPNNYGPNPWGDQGSPIDSVQYGA